MKSREIQNERQHYAVLVATPSRPHRVTLTILAIGATFWALWFTLGAWLNGHIWWLVATVLLAGAQMVWLIKLKK